MTHFVNPEGWKVIVVGKGSREHVLAARLASSPQVREVIVAPGNAGTAREFRNAAEVRAEDIPAIRALARQERPDLVIIGPEAPLVLGVADALREDGFLVFGPGRSGAQLEGSKAFFKAFAKSAGLPTPHYEAFTNPELAHRYLDTLDALPVIKADGLCAGKGVIVPDSRAEAHAAIDLMLIERRFGDAGALILIEERVSGQEVSLHFVTDGRSFVVLPSAQDHKRLRDGDEGPNTGGMGAYAPTPLVDEALLGRMLEQLVKPTVHGLHQQGLSFQGVLFAGCMVDSTGALTVLEFNARFGDPETTVILPLLEEDVAVLLMNAARGELGPSRLAESEGYAAAVVLAAHGYPSAPRAGDEITGWDELLHDGVYLAHAGTATDAAGRTVTAGGRVLTVTATAASLQEALLHAYEAADRIHFDGKQLRRDIGAQALSGYEVRREGA